VGERSPLVVKIGGGLLKRDGWQGLERACAEALELAKCRPVLVVPGGGPFADAVRGVDAQLGLADDVAHVLALQAMDQLGVLLRPLLPDAELLSGLVAPSALALLLAARAFKDRPEIPRSWSVTSDSLAVLAAGAIGAEEAVLLKPVTGLLAREMDGQMTAAALAALKAQGGGQAVDAYLPEAVRRTGVTVVVRAPGDAGTRITPD
jgi:aspartokinase-like uncharacterized kinase